MWKTAWDITSADSGAKGLKKGGSRCHIMPPVRTSGFRAGMPDSTFLNVHPSFALNPPGPTTKEPFAPGALYELKIDTDGDAIADLAYSMQFLSSGDGKQTATFRRIQGERTIERDITPPSPCNSRPFNRSYATYPAPTLRGRGSVINNSQYGSER